MTYYGQETTKFYNPNSADYWLYQATTRENQTTKEMLENNNRYNNHTQKWVRRIWEVRNTTCTHRKDKSVFDKTIISEITDWSHIDYVCIKSKSDDLHVDIYYLDGHPAFEKTLTAFDLSFIDFTRSINSYGISEKMLGDSSRLDRFYVRVNISNEKQELELIDYLKQGKSLSLEQNQILNHLRNMSIATKSLDDYRSLYYCGFSKESESSSYDGVRFYFKTFGTDESMRYDFDCINYCEQCPIIKKDATFQVVRDLILTKRAGLRCIGVELTDSYSVKMKYYLCEIPGGNDISELILEMKKYPQYIRNVNELLTTIPDIQNVHCDLLQISGGCSRGDESINMYLRSQTKYQKKYYSMREGLVLRDIGGISFLVDIHEKHYYDLKNLFSVNETGQVIIKYLMSNGVCTLDGIVSHLRSLIKNYNAELYPVIYSDCKTFVEHLQENGYLLEVM